MHSVELEIHRLRRSAEVAGTSAEVAGTVSGTEGGRQGRLTTRAPGVCYGFARYMTLLLRESVG